MGFKIEVSVPVGAAMVQYVFEAATKEDAQVTAAFLAGAGTVAQPTPVQSAEQKGKKATVTAAEAAKAYQEQQPGKSGAADAAVSAASSPVSATGATTVSSSGGEAGNVKQDASSTPASSEASASTGEKSSPAATAKSFTRDQVAQLVTELVKAAKKDQAIAILSRHGLKVLPKDFADAEVLSSMGAMAEQTLAGTYDPLAAEMPEGAEA